MNGLEIIEINLKDILGTELLRLEAEFYSCKSFKLNKFFTGEDIIDFVQYGTSKELNEENLGFPVLRLNEFDNWFISHPSKSCSLIDKTIFDSLKLLKNDVLICRTNGNPHYVGKSAIVPKDYEYAYASYLFKIRPKNNLINSSTLVAFLNSKYGRMEIEKYSMASNQVNFSPAKFKQLRIPNFSPDIQKRIENIVYLSYEKLDQSKQEFQEAEQLLLEELGLSDFKPNNENISIRKLSDSFGDSGRLDSEYYQPKYEVYQNLISEYCNGSDSLLELCKPKEENMSPKDDIEYKYIELSNISSTGNITSYTKDIGKLLPSRARRKINTGDVIISSIEGSLQSCAVVTDEYDNALCSTGFYIINSKKINSETLLVMFKSPIMQSLLTQSCSGTILTSINKNDFLNIRLPIIKEDIQLQIKDKIKNAFNLKKQSQQLLDLAKHTVEVAITQGEPDALNYIQAKITE